ncbi:MAG: hypothetical protein NC355_01095 [Blautia sp.]|nr:hypothetical protein [Blautia sp.]
MEKKLWTRLITYMLLLSLLGGSLAGCSAADAPAEPYSQSSPGVPESAETETDAPAETEQAAEGEELYLVVEVDQIEESLRLYRYANEMEYRYYYGSGTRFHDKYGNRTTIMNYPVGSVITLGEVDGEGILREAQISDAVWVYDGITRFSVEEERNVFEIADSRYRYDESTYVFSGEERVSMGDIAKGDTLSVVGLDKQILSVNVTTGQGVLALRNTELFEGSYLQLGTRIFAEIMPDMQLSVEEGTYNLIVANNGWGGSREVTVTRGETVTVDLDELKGDGPKRGKIQFLIDVEDAVLIIDGEERDYSKPLELTYGEHSLGVVASGYDVWVRNLFVNSEEATIVIQLMDEGVDTGTVTTTVPSDDGANSGNGGNSGNNSSGNSGSSGSTGGSGSGGNSSSGSDEIVDAIRELIQSQQQQSQLDAIRDLLTSSVF